MSHRACCVALAALVGFLAAAPLIRAGLGGEQRRSIELEERMLPRPLPLTDDPHEAAQLGIDWLVGALCAWMEGPGQNWDCGSLQQQSCFGCHVQAETILGLARSSARCYSIPWTTCTDLLLDESPIEFAARFVAGCQRKPCILGELTPSCAGLGVIPVDDTLDGQLRELGSIGHYPPCGSNAGPASIHPMIQSAHGGLNLAGYSRWVSDAYSGNVVALADWFLTKQQPEGHFIPDRFEAPVDQGESFCTGAATMVMAEARRYGTPLQVAAYDRAIAAARAWSATASHSTTQDQAFAIRTLREAGAVDDDPDLVRVRDVLLAQQLADGGWAERAGLLSNAYATGQAVNALIEAGLAIDDAAICSGIGWLVDNQNPDGSWSLGISGVSTDSNRNESFTATIWPVIALGNLRPFGAALRVESAAKVTCEDEVIFPIRVTHAADTACGLFARSDSYDVSVDNASGDTVWVEPTVIDLGGGDSATVLVHWRRNGGLPPPGTPSITTLTVDSTGARDAGCPVVVESTLTIVVPSDDPPEAVGPTLRVARVEQDLELTWDPLPRALGPYELVHSWRLRRDDALERPSRLVLDPRSAEAVAELSDSWLRLPGAGRRGGPALEFYKVRATSPCTRVPGPTCGIDCGDPERCDSSCP